MIKFNKNKLQTFKCKVNVTGAGENPKITPRLILSPKGSKAKLFFEGKYDDGKCIVEIETGLDFAKKGDLVLEILANSTVFQPWKDTFEIVSEQVVVEGVELIDNDNEIIVEVTDTPKKTSKKQITEVKDPLFLTNSPKVKKQINEYIDRTKHIKNKKAKRRLLKYIVSSYKPKKSILEWAGGIFVNTASPKAKIGMYYAEMNSKKIRESRDANLKVHFPEVEEWKNKVNGSMMEWEVVCKKPWTSSKAEQFQSAVGYDPAGYWFGQFNSKKNIDGSFTYKWKSYSSAG